MVSWQWHERDCDVCGKHYRGRGEKYCSRECYYTTVKGKNNPMYGTKGELSPNWGKKHKPETIDVMRECKLGDKNPLWKGDDVTYVPLHQWITRHKEKPELCEECGIVQPYDLANISGEYKRDIHDFEWLCRKCHMIKDGRLKDFLKNRRNVNENRTMQKLLIRA